MIGGFNNDWTLRLTDTLRFGFDAGLASRPRIRDRKAATPSTWTIDFNQPWRRLSTDVIDGVSGPPKVLATQF